MESAPLADRAQAALALANRDPGRAGPTVAALVADAGAARSWADVAVGEIAWGHALLSTGDAASALQHLRRAVACAKRVGRPDLHGEAAIKLAFAQVQQGQVRRSLKTLDEILPDLDGLLLGRALAQRATNLHLLGDLGGSVAGFRAATRVLRSVGDPGAVQRMLTNFALVLTDVHSFDEADAVLVEAESIARALDRHYAVGVITENRAYVAGLRGDLPVALDLLTRAEQVVTDLGGGNNLALLHHDRAELLLTAGLATEARKWADLAVAESLALHRFLKASEVRLIAAAAALAAGDAPAAVTDATIAIREFARQRRPAWVAQGRLILMRARLAGAPAPVGAVQIRSTVDVLADRARPSEMVEAWVAAARLTTSSPAAALRRQWLSSAAGYTTRSVPAAVRARAWYAEALLRIDHGRPAAAMVALRAGLRVLDEHADTLAATDLRARSAAARDELARTGLRLAVADGRAGPVFGWVERSKASRLRRRVRPPSDAELTGLLAELRSLSGRSETAPERGDPARIAALEDAVRDRYRSLSGVGETDQVTGIVSLADLRAGLHGRVLLDFFESDGTVGVVVVDRTGVRTRTVAPTAEVAALVDRVSFGVRRAAAGNSQRSLRAARGLLAAAVSRLNAVLAPAWPGLSLDGLVISPTGPLHDLPWSVLTPLAGHPITVTPSATAWLRGAPTGRPSGGHPLVIAGPDLPGARSEAAAVAALHGIDAMDDDATADRVLAALPRTSLLHLSAHGRLSAENPLFSSVLLADGPLMVYDLESVPNAPDTVVLASCDTARSQVCTGDELLGLAATLLRRGCTRLIAPVTPVPDRSTGAVMSALHRLLAGGLDPAVALARVQSELRTDEHLGDVAAAFVCLGVNRSG
jgi:tetratricopeptide (TPR) repeat protein